MFHNPPPPNSENDSARPSVTDRCLSHIRVYMYNYKIMSFTQRAHTHDTRITCLQIILKWFRCLFRLLKRCIIILVALQTQLRSSKRTRHVKLSCIGIIRTKLTIYGQKIQNEPTKCVTESSDLGYSVLWKCVFTATLFPAEHVNIVSKRMYKIMEIHGDTHKKKHASSLRNKIRLCHHCPHVSATVMPIFLNP
jgi:hypothetical protein